MDNKFTESYGKPITPIKNEYIIKDMSKFISPETPNLEHVIKQWWIGKPVQYHFVQEAVKELQAVNNIKDDNLIDEIIYYLTEYLQNENTVANIYGLDFYDKKDIDTLLENIK